MPDFQIDIFDLLAGANNSRQLGTIYTPFGGYDFGVDDANRFVFIKTLDGGDSFQTPVQLIAGTNVDRFVVYYDRDTPGDLGDIIHILIANTTAGEMSYFSLDTSTDTPSGLVTVVSIIPAFDPQFAISISKMVGSNLLAGGTVRAGGGVAHFFARSTDGGATWAARAAFTTSTEYVHFQLVPGNEADNQDAWAILSERPNAEVTFAVYDDSADSWSETVLNDGGTFQRRLIAGFVRHSDGHLFALMADVTPGQEIFCWEINGAASITVRTSVTTTAIAPIQNLVIQVDQVNNLIRAVYGEDNPARNVLSRISRDGGVSWGGEAQFNSDSLGQIGPVSVAFSLGAQGGRFQPVWLDPNGQGFGDVGLLTNTPAPVGRRNLGLGLIVRNEVG